MNDQDYFRHHFLVAMPALDDIRFRQAVVFLEEHNEDGAIGLLVNKPLSLQLGKVLEHLDITVKDPEIAKEPVLLGGPVGQDQGFVLHRPWHEPLSDPDTICLSSSKEILRSIANGEGPKQYMVTLGYAGWEPGQLEEEIRHNDWLVVPGDARILFDTALEARWHAAAKLLGVDMNLLSNQSGHA